jgi:general stress protein CsbA
MLVNLFAALCFGVWVASLVQFVEVIPAFTRTPYPSNEYVFMYSLSIQCNGATVP